MKPDDPGSIGGADRQTDRAAEPTVEPTIGTEASTFATIDGSTGGTTGGGVEAESPRPEVPVDASRRYRRLGRLGVGGMSVVDRMHDTLLERDVALKTLKWSLVDSASARARFDVESTITASLEHPGIVPVYDRGRQADGRAWYAMKLLDGQSLSAALEAGLGPRRGIDAVLRVTEAVAYAHDRAVVHRDIKPSNIMLGTYGEILLIDWGIARRIDDGSAPPSDGPTRMLGTPGYMAPEQIIDAASVGPPADVFALGVTLYRVVCGATPWPGGTGAALAARRTDPWPEVTVGPAPLRALIRSCLDPDPAGRPSARDLADALRRWSDGELARERARAWVEQARAIEPEAARLRAEAHRARAEAATLLDGIPMNAPVAEKRTGWRREADAEHALRAARQAEFRHLGTLRSALELAPDLPEARAAINACYRARLLASEAASDGPRVDEYAALLEQHDPEGNAVWLRGDGRVTVVTDAPDTTIEVLRFEEIDRRLEPRPTGQGWHGPVIDMPLQMGRYLLRLTAPGRHPVAYPVHIERAGRWHGIRPGSDRPHPIHMPPLGALGPDDRYVPAGWCATGGDPLAPDGMDAQPIWIDGFAMRCHPVTQAEFLNWLESLRAGGRVDEALRRAPLDEDPGPTGDRLFYDRTPDGGFALRAAYGMNWGPGWPVVRIDWHTAMAYASHHADIDGLPWRLPHSWEWEKAARGVDGRVFPWGEHLDPTWAAMLQSFDGPPEIEPVGARPADVSVYGVRGTTGNVREYCLDRYRRAGPIADDGICRIVTETPGADDFIVVRGGSHESQPRFCRPAGRFGLKPTRGILSVGFRLCRTLDPHAPD